MSFKDRAKRVIAGGAAAVGLTLGVAALAGAATPPDQAPKPPSAETSQANNQDPALKGSIQAPEDNSASEADETKALKGLAKVSSTDAEQAASTAVPGGTINGSQLGNENGSVIYEVDVIDANGQSVDVKVDAGNGDVLAQENGNEASEANEGSKAEANEAPEGSEASQTSPTG